MTAATSRAARSRGVGTGERRFPDLECDRRGHVVDGAPAHTPPAWGHADQPHDGDVACAVAVDRHGCRCPRRLRGLDLAPRHLSLLSYLLLDGPSTVSQLAERLEVAPTTVSLMVGDLTRRGVLVRREDDADRRRRIVEISPEQADAVGAWLAPGAAAWRTALAPLSAAQRRTVVDALRAYEEALGRPDEPG